MVVIRESPRKAVALAEEKQWPPRSSREALLSSPSGRKKYQQRMLDRTSPSPSPRRRPQTDTSDTLDSFDLPPNVEDDDDEETAMLKLQEIQARLKLKQIRQAKAKLNKTVDGEDSRSEVSSRPATAMGAQRDRPQSVQSFVQVPTSPVRDRKPPEAQQKSPARVILGIDKGLKATDVSLKRAANSLGTTSRSDSLRRDRPGSSSSFTDTLPRSKSFSERIKESRLSEREVQEKENRIKQARSTGFGIGVEAKREANRGTSNLGRLSPTKRSSAFSENSRSVSSKEVSRPSSSGTSGSASKTEAIRRSASLSARHPLPREAESNVQDREDIEPDDRHTIEPYSGLHLSKRLIEHDTLTRTFHGKELYTLPRLLKEVKSPDYDPPDCETDYIVLGIIASKSTPRDQKASSKSISTSGEAEDKARQKFMAMRLTDLKWEIDVFLFDSGFERFWKLIPGTVVALLNPGIMPPRNKDKGDFSLKLTSSDDTVLEIGKAKHLGFCSAMRADGTQCPAWIDNRKTQVCEFHLNLQLEKTRRGRMEINGMPSSSGKGSWRRGKKDDGLLREGKYHDKHLRETMWIAPKEFSRPTSSLIDADHDYNAFERGMSKEELQRKRRQEQKKEIQLAKKLSLQGTGAGSEYLKARVGKTSSSTATSYASTATSTDISEAPDAKSLGLLNNKAGDVHLSPIKGRTKTGAFRQEPMGWSGAFKRGLPSPTRGLSPTRESSMKKRDSQRSPSPKKARFILENKGIREPGRESLPGNGAGGCLIMDDDDDDLDIIK